MEEIEITSWLTLDAIKKEAEIVETTGDLQSGHCVSIFCQIEDDFLELCYSDMASNFLRRYEDKEEFELALEKRQEEFGEVRYGDEAETGEGEFSEDLEDEYSEDSDNF
ncbi:MAG: hypothetical protein PVF22_04300 [Candidatus Aminicenantes bacterium]|jgi:hypothetical protein